MAGAEPPSARGGSGGVRESQRHVLACVFQDVDTVAIVGRMPPQ